MYKKKRLKSIEDVIAYKDTDTKIYIEGSTNSYLKFVNGVLCRFYSNGGVFVNAGESLSLTTKWYVKENVPYSKQVEEATAEDIGKLCMFWDLDHLERGSGVIVSRLKNIMDGSFITNVNARYDHCTVLNAKSQKLYLKILEDYANGRT